MPRIHVIDRKGATFTLDADVGAPLMEALRAHGDVEAVCGGSAACATCHVHIDEAWFDRVGEPTAEELTLLEYSMERRPTSRLSCQIVVGEGFDGLQLEVAASEG